MKAKLYVKYDIEADTLIAGPQGGMESVDGWYPLIFAESDDPRQRFELKFIEDLGVVVQMPEQKAAAPFGYRELRSEANPKIGDLMDMLFHDIENNELNRRGSFFAALKAVKDAYPKPE